MRRSKNDSKSQNSDYGSFCNTPSDNFGGSSGITNSAVTSLANGSDEGRVGNVANGGEGEEPDNANNTGDGTMPVSIDSGIPGKLKVLLSVNRCTSTATLRLESYLVFILGLRQKGLC